MDSFEELGIAPELVEALAAEGIERPTPLQQAAVPVVRKANNVVLAAGPGSGLMVAWAAGLLDRIAADADAPGVLVLTASAESADRLGESLARLSLTSGHAVAALGGSWVLPDRAQLLLGTPEDVLAAVGDGRVSLSGVQAVVIDQAQDIDALGALEDVERVLDYVDAGCQRIVTALPVTDAVGDLVERHVRRAITVPGAELDAPPKRGEVRFRIHPEPREAGTLAVVAELLDDDARHVLVYCGSEDRAADVGDYLTLHGYTAGAPGDATVPVWLGVDALETRAAIDELDGLVVVSSDVPADPDTLDRRHSLVNGGVIIVLPREVAHLRRLGKTTGYDTVPFPPPARRRTAVDELRATVERALDSEDIAPYLVALEPLFDRYDPAEVAAAAVALLRRKGPAPSASTGSATSTPAPDPSAPAAGPAWAKLFVGVGERDGLRPGDLLGAIVGESGVSGDAVGRIDIKESHSVVEVHDAVARKVIRAINGTTIKGRAVRADFDRPRKNPPRRGRPRS